jgi:hypothetical protein
MVGCANVPMGLTGAGASFLLVVDLEKVYITRQPPLGLSFFSHSSSLVYFFIFKSARVLRHAEHNLLHTSSRIYKVPKPFKNGSSYWL